MPANAKGRPDPGPGPGPVEPGLDLWGGSGNDTLAGGGGPDQIIGNEGADSLVGAGGDDSLWGGIGFDPSGVAPDGDDTLDGGAGHDQLWGAGGDDCLIGGAGNDLLSGWYGNDILLGGDGADTLRCEWGSDTLSGGAGADIFFFTFFTPGDVNLITDFNRSQGDRIDLSPLDPDPVRSGDQSYAFIGTGAFSGRRAEVRYQISGGETIVEVDNGDGVTDFTIRLTGAIALTKSDFVL